MNPARLCIICKGGRNLCGNTPCPLLKRLNVIPKIRNIKESFFGPSPSIFIGRYGYPFVNIGPLGIIDENRFIDDPTQWFGLEYDEIIRIRSLILRSKKRESIFSRNRIVEYIQELALAEKPTDIEMRFKGKPVYRMEFSDIIQPLGPSAELLRLKITENPKISKVIEYVVSDDISAKEAGFMLYEKGYDVYKIAVVLSSGVLGFRKRRKMVPTRWSITCIDDMIFKKLIERIKTYKYVNKYLIFESHYLHNHFVTLLIPGSWEFENFEAWAPGSYWAYYLKKPEILREYEPFEGRKSYAETQGGGYYACRIGVVEGLEKLKRQAKVVVFREIDEGYNIPLGVWVVRETVRNAFRNNPKCFESLKESLEFINSRLKLDINMYMRKSHILRQKTLMDF